MEVITVEFIPIPMVLPSLLPTPQ